MNVFHARQDNTVTKERFKVIVQQVIFVMVEAIQARISDIFFLHSFWKIGNSFQTISSLLILIKVLQEISVLNQENRAHMAIIVKKEPMKLVYAKMVNSSLKP